MKKPTKKKKAHPSDGLQNVVENGLQFIERGVKELWNTRDKPHLKHSVINFYSGVELLLKARLMMEHWALVVSDTKQADAEKFLSGDFRSVGLDDAVARLKKIAGLDIPPAAYMAFKILQNHRNQMVHFFHRTNIRTSEGRKLKAQVIKEQCVGWFFLRRLIGDAWSEEFHDFQTRVGDINVSMKKHNAYLGTVYEQIKPELKVEVQKGAELGHCYSCGYNAHIVDEVGPFETNCRVCTAYGSFLSHKCEGCSKFFLVEQGDENVECPDCGTSCELNDLMEHYSEEGEMLPEDFLIDGGYGNCVECNGYHTVGTVGEEAFCFSCHQFQAPMGVCEWCNEKATGDLEMSYFGGCVMCDGKAGWDSDKD